MKLELLGYVLSFQSNISTTMVLMKSSFSSRPWRLLRVVSGRLGWPGLEQAKPSAPSPLVSFTALQLIPSSLWNSPSFLFSIPAAGSTLSTLQLPKVLGLGRCREVPTGRLCPLPGLRSGGRDAGDDVVNVYGEKAAATSACLRLCWS